MRAAAVKKQRQGSRLDDTSSGRLWQQHGCTLGIKTVVAQAVAQAQGTDGAHGRGASGSRGAGQERRTQGETEEQGKLRGGSGDGVKEIGGGGGGGGMPFYKGSWATERS